MFHISCSDMQRKIVGFVNGTWKWLWYKEPYAIWIYITKIAFIRSNLILHLNSFMTSYWCFKQYHDPIQLLYEFQAFKIWVTFTFQGHQTPNLMTFLDSQYLISYYCHATCGLTLLLDKIQPFKIFWVTFTESLLTL